MNEIVKRKHTRQYKKAVPTTLARIKNSLQACQKRTNPLYLWHRQRRSRGWLLSDAGSEEVRQLTGRETCHSAPNSLPKSPLPQSSRWEPRPYQLSHPKRSHPATIQPIHPLYFSSPFFFLFFLSFLFPLLSFLFLLAYSHHFLLLFVFSYCN